MFMFEKESKKSRCPVHGGPGALGMTEHGMKSCPISLVLEIAKLRGHVQTHVVRNVDVDHNRVNVGQKLGRLAEDGLKLAVVDELGEVARVTRRCFFVSKCAHLHRVAGNAGDVERARHREGVLASETNETKLDS